jgi:hypothetical protein
VPDFAGVFEDDLRGGLELLAVSPNLRAALGLTDKLPHYMTLQKFSARADSDDWPGGGRARVCPRGGSDGCHRFGNDDRQRAF